MTAPVETRQGTPVPVRVPATPHSRRHAGVTGSQSFKPGNRVLCKPAQLTGEVVGSQGEWIGVRYDIGYIQWESPADLRHAHRDQTTGTEGLSPSEPLFPQQQSRIIRSERHFGFDNAVLQAAISCLPAQFRTRDVSLQRDVLNAHPFAATMRNYHAMVGKHLSASRAVLGIQLLSETAHAKGALWSHGEPQPVVQPTLTEVPVEMSPRAPAANAADPPEDATALEALRRDTEAQIDNFLRSVGVVTPTVDAEGVRRVVFGSAQGMIAVIQADDSLCLRVIASVIDLPSDGDLILPLMRDLLEHNGNVSGPARAAIIGSAVVVTATLPANDLRAQDVGFVIDNAMAVADTMAKPLLERYGGSSKQRD